MAVVRLVLAFVLAAMPAIAFAQPVPPCTDGPTPAYGRAGAPPNTGLWTENELRKSHWVPAACLGWRGETKLVAAVASRFHENHDVFDRVAAISAWPGIRYWSVTRQSWRPLALATMAVDASGRREGNGSPATLLPGGHESLFVERGENSAETTYRLRVLERTDRRMVVAMENVTPIRIAILTVFEPGALQTVTFVQKEADNGWSTYQITRVGNGGSAFALAYKASFLNRLEAVRRYLAGEATDQEPPLVRR